MRQARRERAKGVKEQGQENYSYDGYEKGRYNKKGDDIEYGKTKDILKKSTITKESTFLQNRIYGY